MEVTVEQPPDEETARAIATALSEHLGEPVELVADGETVASYGGEADDWEEAVVTEREQALREDVEAILSGGPERGHEKLEELGKLFVRDRLDRIFDTIEYEDGTFARYDEDGELPADGLITGVGTIRGRTVFFAANDYSVKAGSLGQMGVEKEIRLAERAVESHPAAHRLDGRAALAGRARRGRHPHGPLPGRPDVLQPVHPQRPGPTDRRAVRSGHRRVGVHAGVL
jgi:hypothetical protein